MKVRGTANPGIFAVEEIPEKNRSLIRLFQNVTPCHEEDFNGFEYDEYHVEVETWDGVNQNVIDNYDVFLEAGMKNDPNYMKETLKSIIDLT